MEDFQIYLHAYNCSAFPRSRPDASRVYANDRRVVPTRFYVRYLALPVQIRGCFRVDEQS